MKKTLFLFFLTTFCVVNQAKAQSLFDKWAELKAFHGVMSQTFHPAEEGNLDPIKTRSGEMAEKAAVLSKSTFPAEFQKPEIKKAVSKLKKDSKALDTLIKSKKATDSQITQSLSALHNVFHEIVGLCQDENH